GEHQATYAHRPVHEESRDHRESGQRDVHRDGPAPALQPRRHDHRHREHADEPHLPGLEVGTVVEPRDHREHETDHDGLEEERAGHDAAQSLPRVHRGGVCLPPAGGRAGGVAGLGVAHCASFPNRLRAAPAVTTDPVTRTPTPETSSWAVGSGTPTRSSAALTASGSVSTTWTRWEVNRS